MSTSSDLTTDATLYLSRDDNTPVFRAQSDNSTSEIENENSLISITLNSDSSSSQGDTLVTTNDDDESYKSFSNSSSTQEISEQLTAQETSAQLTSAQEISTQEISAQETSSRPPQVVQAFFSVQTDSDITTDDPIRVDETSGSVPYVPPRPKHLNKKLGILSFINMPTTCQSLSRRQSNCDVLKRGSSSEPDLRAISDSAVTLHIDVVDDGSCSENSAASTNVTENSSDQSVASAGSMKIEDKIPSNPPVLPKPPRRSLFLQGYVSQIQHILSDNERKTAQVVLYDAIDKCDRPGLRFCNF